ncbi:DUF4124 domain-containing protein [Arenimonas sp.]|uniref:DUF4124 domain-containing protein n=1 Tax=Arenimonas sp. TaxID=1872635 RepID=UPI002E318F06|nr:DUF4124 domain-containing protein [Arenimonas sp.]HEX4855028.1 DUF4124 domain-containing protein [Arenimonas sp.]
MSRPVLLIALALGLAPGPLLADKTTVYKSTNADGTSVYSQVETRDAQVQRVDGRDPNLPPAQAEAAPKSEAEKACETATKNLELIGSGQRLQRDKDGDGTPEDLTPEELATEKDLAQRQADAYCAPAK